MNRVAELIAPPLARVVAWNWHCANPSIRYVVLGYHTISTCGHLRPLGW